MAPELRRFIRPLKANWGLKLLALLLAALTYQVIRGVTGYEVEYDVPVQVVVEQGVAVLNQTPMSSRVRFRGSRDDLLRLNQQQIKLVVRPVAGAEDGPEKRIPLLEQNVEGVAGVHVVRIDPPEVHLTFDREVEVTFPVAKPDMLGSPLVGKADVEYEPRAVRIRGPRQRLEQLRVTGKNGLTTEPVDVEGRMRSFTRKVRVIPPGDTWLSHIEPAEITVKVNITTESASRTWDRVPVQLLLKAGASGAVRAEPTEVTVGLAGRAEILEKVTGDGVRVFVDCTNLNGPGEYELPLNAHYPNPAELTATIKPQTVRIVVLKP